MRKRSSTEALLFPHLRQRLLATLLLHPDREKYLSELARELGASAAHLHRELAILSSAGILSREVKGRQVYYQPNKECPYLPELTALIRKTMGVDSVLAKALRPLARRIRCAFMFGSLARGEEKPGSDVDLMVVGDVTISDLVPALRRAEKQIGRAVNPTAYSAEELARKMRDGHHFVRAVVADPAKQFIVGAQNDLEEVTRRGPDKTSPDQQSRTRRAARGRRG